MMVGWLGKLYVVYKSYKTRRHHLKTGIHLPGSVAMVLYAHKFVLKSGMNIKRGPSACSVNVRGLGGLKGCFKLFPLPSMPAGSSIWKMSAVSVFSCSCTCKFLVPFAFLVHQMTVAPNSLIFIRNQIPGVLKMG